MILRDLEKEGHISKEELKRALVILKRDSEEKNITQVDDSNER